MKFKYIIFAFLIALSIVGCSANNSETVVAEATSNDNTIATDGAISVSFLNGSSKTLTLNSEVVSIEVTVFGADNSPYTDGNVSVSYPDKVQTGTDVGSFLSSTVEVTNGRAVFNYTAPKDLQDRVDNGDTSTVFGFYHSSDIKTVKNYTFTYSPVANQKILTTYALKQTSANSGVTMELESSLQMAFYVEDDKNIKVDDSKFTSIKVELLNTALADIEDTFGNSGDTLTFLDKNNVSLNVKSFKVSGVVPIRVTAIFENANGNSETITEIFNVVILSGPPTAISISYASTSQDVSYAKFQENLVVTVTDKYFNYVNTKPAIITALIVGYAYDGATRIYYDPAANRGTLNPTTDMFTAGNAVDFSSVDETNEFLMTFGTGYKYAASGKWDFTRTNAPNTNDLKLIDDFDANASVSELGFAVGRNQREDQCIVGSKWVGTIATADGTNEIDSRGMAKLTLNYDYYLAGKSVVVAVNLVGYTASTGVTSKVGEAKKITLRTTGLEAAILSVPRDVVNTQYLIPISMKDAPEWYRNANFNFKYKLSANLSLTAGPTMVGQVGSCATSPAGAGSGVAYVQISVTENKGETGSIEITDVVVSSEF